MVISCNLMSAGELVEFEDSIGWHPHVDMSEDGFTAVAAAQGPGVALYPHLPWNSDLDDNSSNDFDFDDDTFLVLEDPALAGGPGPDLDPDHAFDHMHMHDVD
jgi:hypothetical protein